MIEDLSKLLNQSINEDIKHSQIYINVKIISDLFEKVENSFNSLLFKKSLNPERLDSSMTGLDMSNEIDKMNIGNLIPLSCGHNGNYNDREINYIKLELEKSGFLKY